MNILRDDILYVLPAIGSTDGQGGDAVALAKLFTPWGSWTWYLTEASREGNDIQMFGLVDGHERELGYVSLNELMSVRGPMDLAVERDLFWSPKKLGDIAPELFTAAAAEFCCRTWECRIHDEGHRGAQVAKLAGWRRPPTPVGETIA